MKKVLLLGDSIRMGYDDMVKEMLDGEMEVCYDAEDNGRFAAYTLWQANQLFKHCGPFDVVHWNNGYWDMNVEAPMTEAVHPIEEYKRFLRRIVRFCREQGAQVIFATTVPICEEGESQDNTGTGARINYNNDWVKAYNEAAKDVMREENVKVNDLYELCMQREDRYKCEDMLHLTEEGYRECAKQVVACVREVLA